MTKSTITREQQRQILIDTAKHIISRERTSPYSENLRELARIALAAMDREPVIPDEMTAEQAYEIGYYYGDPVDVFARGANWMRQHIINSTLAASPQEDKP